MKYTQSQLILDSLRAPIESYLLADAVQVKPQERVLDIGCGNGIIALSLAVNHPSLKRTVGIELVRDHLVTARSKYEELSRYNNNLVQCEWVNGDVRSFPFQQQWFDVIVSNPPFYPTQHSIHSPDKAKTVAHMDGSLSPTELLKSVNQLLKNDSRFYVVYPISRLDEVRSGCETFGLRITERDDHLDVRKRSGGITILTIQRESEDE